VARLTKPAGTITLTGLYTLTVPRTVWRTCVSSSLAV